MSVNIQLKPRVLSTLPEGVPKDFTGLSTLADRLRKKWLGGVCLHRGTPIEERDPKRNLWAVPINRWLS